MTAEIDYFATLKQYMIAHFPPMIMPFSSEVPDIQSKVNEFCTKFIDDFSLKNDSSEDWTRIKFSSELFDKEILYCSWIMSSFQDIIYNSLDKKYFQQFMDFIIECFPEIKSTDEFITSFIPYIDVLISNSFFDKENANYKSLISNIKQLEQNEFIKKQIKIFKIKIAQNTKISEYFKSITKYEFNTIFTMIQWDYFHDDSKIRLSLINEERLKDLIIRKNAILKEMKEIEEMPIDFFLEKEKRRLANLKTTIFYYLTPDIKSINDFIVKLQIATYMRELSDSDYIEIEDMIDSNCISAITEDFIDSIIAKKIADFTPRDSRDYKKINDYYLIIVKEIQKLVESGISIDSI